MTTKQEFNCVFCKDVFVNKEELQEHFRKHGDPKFKNRFEVDSQADDEKSKEKAELVSCDVCSQMFSTISKAITHKHKMHPDHDAKYFCPWCGKLFTMKHLYNVHVQSNHGNQEKTEDKCFRCDSCSVDFFIPSAMINHNKFFHRQDTDLPDIGQSKKFKMYNQEVIHIYYCAFCGEEYENKVNLFKHITDDHGDENQSPEEVLKCPLCEAVFYHLDAYEIHLTFHTSEDMYSINNTEYSDLPDYSLETVPPIIEKLESLETEGQNEDAESTINAVGIEKFLELAMDQSDESNSVKVKKHKKRKKSKKAAITLDEFLNMNQDVFGEDLDFQGIEEIPTRIVKKQLKNNKKSTNSRNLVELEKLKKAGIVIKKKACRNPTTKSPKVITSRPAKIAQNKSFNKINLEREIKTSSEVLTKLINQSNNQIKIVKKCNPDNGTNEPKRITKDIPNEVIETFSENASKNVKDLDHNINQLNIIPISKPEGKKIKSEDITNDLSCPDSDTATTKNPMSNKLDEININSNVVRQITKANSNNIQIIPKSENNERYDGPTTKDHDEEINKDESDQDYSDPELEQRDYIPDADNFDKNNRMDEIQGYSNIKSSQQHINSSKLGTFCNLKHLSHLITVKPVTKNYNTTSAENSNYKIGETKDNTNSQKDTYKEIPYLLSITDKASLSKQKNIVDKDPTLDALKNMSKNITIKSLSTKTTMDESEAEDDGEMNGADITNHRKLTDVSGNKNLTIKKLEVETSEPKLDSTNINYINSEEKKPQYVIPLNNKPVVRVKPSRIIVENAENGAQTTNTNILKHPTNITKKPVINQHNYLSPIGKQNISKKVVQLEDKKEEVIEIFDIDDSEDENDKNSDQLEPSQNAINSMAALKNLSKNITFKCSNQQSVQNNVKLENNVKVEKQKVDSPGSHSDDSNVDAQNYIQNRNMVVKNVLQGLCKNITIKSLNSPSQSIKSPDYTQDYPQDFKIMEDSEASDSDSGNIKIAEIDEEIFSNENDSERFDEFNINDNPIVEQPNDSCGENEIDEKIYDFEAEIKVSTVQKSSQNMNSTISPACLNNLKNISKNITIKSLGKSSTENQDKPKPAHHIHDSSETPNNQKRQLPIKSSKQIIKEPQRGNISPSRNLGKDFGLTVNHPSSTQSSNQTISSVNQVNTTNKAVTVKTIQTKTVIQEITTTVTKTIKTVNQTLKQEVRNTLQTNTPTATQRIQGIRPSQPKNLQGVVIRHAAPNLVTKTCNMVSQIRPANTVVKPSKQVVPVRAGMNLTRPNNPRMAIAKRATPSPSPNKQVIGKPLKISPTALASSTIKRPNTEDVSGPFSCFKKPKESLIPVSDLPSFANSGGEATAQFTAASHTSSSNFSSTTKTIKGNSVVTAKQVRSEVSATTQQLSRLNTTGLKIMTSQAKQTQHTEQVQEKSETSAMKRTTLEAIQRLQKQGLLVKKPRIDTNEGSRDSDHYGSADKPDE